MGSHADLQCQESGCTFYAKTIATLSNHQQQKHKALALKVLTCPYCGGQYKKQDLVNHVMFSQVKASIL